MAGARPLRVAHVGPSMARGGAEIHAAGLARFLDPARVVLARCVVTGTHSYDACTAAAVGVPVVVGGHDEVRRAAAECDALLIWGAPYDEYLAGHRPKLCVHLAHGESVWTRRALEGSRASVDHVVAVSQRVADKVCEGFPTTVIPNGIDRSRVAQTRPRGEVRAALGFAPDDFVLLYCGRFSVEKRPHVVIEAVAGLPPRFKALLVGSGGLGPSLRALAAEKAPGRCAFASASSDVGDYYAAADAMVSCSEEEGSSLAIIEAMFAGLPIVATPVGAVPEMQASVRGGLFAVVDGSPESVARAAAGLGFDGVGLAWRAVEMAERARAYAHEHCYARTMADRYADLLCGLWKEKT